jgi:hypothetical protein
MTERHGAGTDDEHVSELLQYAAFALMGGLIPPEIHETPENHEADGVCPTHQADGPVIDADIASDRCLRDDTA